MKGRKVRDGKMFNEYFAQKITVIAEERRKGVKKALQESWRGFLRGSFCGVKQPMCCRFCCHVGTPQWHCFCANSIKLGINVMPWNVCSKWEPCVPLLMFVDEILFREKIEASRKLASKEE